MKQFNLLLLLIFTSGFCFAQYPPLSWAKKVEAVDQVNSMCSFIVKNVDESGNIYASGYFRDTVRPEQSLPNYYLTGNNNWDSGLFGKYDASGNLIWANKIVARVGYFSVNDLSVDKHQNVYVVCNAIYADTIDFDPGAGVTNTISDGNDFFFAKYDANGNFLWVKLLNVANSTNQNSNKPNAIVVDSNLNIYIGGQFQSQMDIDPSATTVNIVNPSGVNCNCTVGFYAKYDSNGALLWYQIDGNNSGVNAMAVDNITGNILIGATGSQFSGNPLRLCNSSGTSLHFLASANIGVNSVKFDAAGNIYYSGTFANGGNDFDWGAGSFLMSTAHSYEPSGFAGKYSSAGIFQWAVAYSTGATNYFGRYYNISMDATDGNPLLSYGESNGNGYLKGFYKIDSMDGSALWGNSMFSPLVGLAGANALASPSDGTVVFSMDAGFSSNSVVTFDVAPNPAVTTNISGTGYWSMIAKYGACISAPDISGSVTGATALCSTASQTYSVPATNGADSYVWTLPSGWSGTSTARTISVTPSTNGGTISVVANNLCGTSTARTLVVSYTAPPNVGTNAAATTLCAGGQTTLTGTGATSYVWNNGVTDGVAFTPASTTTYTVTGTTLGCSATASVNVTVNAIPNVGTNATATTLCAGGQTTLTGTGATSYVWNNGVTDGVAFTPASTTAYTVTGTTLGCSATASVSVTVNSIPNVGANAAATTLCEGGQTTLTGTGATSYAWNNGITNGVAYTPASTTAYTVTGTTLGCSATASVSVTVNSIPNVETNATATTLCVGGQTTLTGTGATSYVWNNGVTDGVAFTPASTNTYTVIGTTNGCSDTASVSIAVNIADAISVFSTSDTVCIGETASLIAIGAVNYLWSTTDIGDSVLVSPTATTVYSVTASDANGCISTANREIAVYNAVDVSTTVNGFIITANAINAIYQWRNCTSNLDIAGANDQAYTATANGDYQVRVQATTGCVATSQCETITGLGVSEVLANMISVFPNPFTEQFSILFSALKGEYIVDVYSAFGQLVKHEKITSPLATIDLTECAGGIYLVRIITAQIVLDRKLLKE